MAKSSNSSINIEQVHELLFQALETEIGGQQVYEAAIDAAQNEDLRQEWQKYLEQTRHHEQVLLGVLERFGLDPQLETPGREVVADLAESLVDAIEMARESADPKAAELVAGECVILAETKDHQNWELIGMVAKGLDDAELAEVLQSAYDEVEEEEDKHVYHNTGWTRELWLDSLGLPAELPPPEEIKHITSKRGSARIEEQRHKLS